MKAKNNTQLQDDVTGDETAPTGALKDRLLQRFDKYKDRPWWRLETGLIVGAVLLGLVSAALSNANQSAQTEALRREFTMAQVLVVTKDLAVGQALDRSSVATDTRLQKGVSENFAPATEQMYEMVIGKRTAIDLKAGDPILLSAVQGATDASRISEKIPPGKRLFTLTIAGKATGYGWVKPNDHVDVIANIDLPGRGHTTFTALEDVTLVSVGASTVLDRNGQSSGSDVSFFVMPEEFEVLAFAQQRGSFTLGLRNPKDVARTRTGSRGVDINGFLDHATISGASGGGELKVIENGKAVKDKKEGGQ